MVVDEFLSAVQANKRAQRIAFLANENLVTGDEANSCLVPGLTGPEISDIDDTMPKTLHDLIVT